MGKKGGEGKSNSTSPAAAAAAKEGSEILSCVVSNM
jgi:Mrp family chromosome partitioning ATPase